MSEPHEGVSSLHRWFVVQLVSSAGMLPGFGGARLANARTLQTLQRLQGLRRSWDLGLLEHSTRLM